MKMIIACAQQSLRLRLAKLAATSTAGAITAVLADTSEVVDRQRRHPADVVVLGVHEPEDVHTVLELADGPAAPAILMASALDAPMVPKLEESGAEYVLEHVQPHRFTALLHRADRLTAGQLMALQASLEEGRRRHILCRRRAGLGLIPVNDVRYFVADHKYVTVEHDDGEDLIEESLCQLEAEFGPRFLRLHRSALVARDALRGLEKDFYGQTHAVIDGTDQRLPVSRRRLPAVRRWLRETAQAY